MIHSKEISTLKKTAWLGTLLVAAGCSRESIAVYRIPKETNQLGSVSRSQASDSSAARPEVRWASVPAGWKQLPATSMRVGNFMIEGASGQVAEVSIMPLGAPNLENQALNMWRNELGLEPLALSAGGETIPLAGSSGNLYDLGASKNKEGTRILGVILERAGVTWVFKLKGPDALVAQQRSAFTDFLKGVSFAEVTAAIPGGHPPVSAGAPVQTGDAPAKPAWEVPSHWQEQPPKMMVIASYAVSGDGGKAEVAISAFPGDVGGLVANLTRWRRPLGLPPATEADVPKCTRPVEIAGGKGALPKEGKAKCKEWARLDCSAIPRRLSWRVPRPASPIKGGLLPGL